MTAPDLDGLSGAVMMLPAARVTAGPCGSLPDLARLGHGCWSDWSGFGLRSHPPRKSANGLDTQVRAESKAAVDTKDSPSGARGA